MTDLTYFAGSGIDCVVPFGDNCFEDTAYAYGGEFEHATIYCGPGGGNYFDCYMRNADGTDAAATDFWTHWVSSRRDHDSRPNVQWYKADGTEVIRCNGDDHFSFWNGSSWTDTTVYLNEGDRDNLACDIYVKVGVSGTIAVYHNKILQGTYSGDTSGIGSVGRIRFSSVGNGGGGYSWYHQMIVANYNTIGHQVRVRYPTGNGTNTAWAGDYTAVDDVPYDDADTITSDTASQKETYTGATLSGTTLGNIIKAVAVGSRARINTDGPQNIAHMLRIGSTDYVAPYNMKGLNLGYAGGVTVWQKNPATDAAWASISDADCEFGVESVA